MDWLNIGKYANDFFTFIERLNSSNTGTLLLVFVVGATLLGLVVMSWAVLSTLEIRVVQCVLGTITTVILVPTIAILGFRGLRNINKRVKKFQRRRSARKRLSKGRKDPTLERRHD